MFRLVAALSSAKTRPVAEESVPRFCVSAPRRTRELFCGIMLLILIGSATCTILFNGLSGGLSGGVAPNGALSAEYHPADNGHSAAVTPVDQ